MASFYLPDELQRLINDFARPCTRPDWRRGGSIARTLDSSDLYRFQYELEILEQCRHADEDEHNPQNWGDDYLA